MRISSYICIGLVLLVAACGGKKGGSSDDGGSGEEPATNVPQTGGQPGGSTGGTTGDPVVPLPNDDGSGNNGGGSGGGSNDGGTDDGGTGGGTPTSAKVYFAKGYLVTRFPSDVSTQGNFQAWNPMLRPSRVANGSNVLTTDYVVKTVERE